MKGIRKHSEPSLSTKLVRDESIELLKSNIDNIGVHLPIREEDILTIYEWFQNREIEMANALAAGVDVNLTELDLMSNAADDFRIYEGQNEIDLEDLNNRLRFIAPIL